MVLFCRSFCRSFNPLGQAYKHRKPSDNSACPRHSFAGKRGRKLILADLKSIWTNGEFSLCNSAWLTKPASSRLTSRNRNRRLRKNTLDLVGVFGRSRNARSIKGTRFAGFILPARSSHAARESSAEAFVEDFFLAFKPCQTIASAIAEQVHSLPGKGTDSCEMSLRECVIYRDSAPPFSGVFGFD